MPTTKPTAKRGDTTQPAIKKLVARLCGLPGHDPGMFGEDAPSAMREDLGKALESAVNDSHATRVVDELVARCRFRPTPAEIRAGILATPEKIAAMTMSPDPDCSECNGSGFRWEVRGESGCRRCGGSGRVNLDRAGGAQADCACALHGAAKCGCWAVREVPCEAK